MIKLDKRGLVLFVVLLVGFFFIFDYLYANTSKEEPGEKNGIQAESELVPTATDDPVPPYQESGDPEEPGESEHSWGDANSGKEPQDSQTIEDTVLLDSILLLVNKSYQLPSDYVPRDLTEAKVRFSPNVVPSKKMLRAEAAQALEELFQSAESQNIFLYGVSGYRSYQTQKGLYERKVETAGQAMADKYVAYPGRSEHQTGLAMDVTNEKGINKSLTEDFGESREGQWLAENAHVYGFIIRYPLGKEEITGYSYEPWHIRYVGKSVAEYIYANKLVLEEYLDEPRLSFVPGSSDVTIEM